MDSPPRKFIARSDGPPSDPLKEAIGGMLHDMSKMLFVYALTNLAMAAYASTEIGAVMLGGTPSQFLKAAALFGAAGTAAGLASRALGGGEQTNASSGGGGGGHSRATAAGAGARWGSQSFTLIVNGNIDDRNRDQITRDVMKLLRTAAADGA